MDVRMVYTDNPFVDTLVYSLKQLIYGTVLKDEERALNNETLNSLRNSVVYISCINNTVVFEQLTYSEELLIYVGLTGADLYNSLIDKNNIPDNKRAACMKKAKEDVINNYVEENNYYRMLNGEPYLNELGLKVTDWTPPDDVVIDLNKYVHEMTSSEIALLNTYGIITKLREDNPEDNYEYLEYLGEKKISYVISRSAGKFQAIYIPSVESVDIYEKFKDKLITNTDFTMRTIYSEAFKFGSDYYEAFIMILIIIQTLIDILDDIQELILNRALLDIRSIQFIFQSYGIPFYSEIPIKYQINMIKNINILLKYKSTSRNMVDIASLFGFDDIEIFKYYLLRQRNINEDGTYFYETKEIPDPEDPDRTITVPDNEKNYDLKFVRVPIEDDDPDVYMRDPSNHLSYADVVAGDPTWTGTYGSEYVYNEIINREFNYVKSKYISIDNIYDVANMSFEMVYWYNMLFDDFTIEGKLVEENIKLLIPAISNEEVRLTDTFVLLYALTYSYYNIVDKITKIHSEATHILGFNFKANMQELGSYVAEQGFTLEELGVDFMIPTESLSYNSLLNIFLNNKKVRNHLIDQINKADSKRMYDIYYTLYKALMITEFNLNYFSNRETGEIFDTYTDYLSYKDQRMYDKLIDIKDITDMDDRRIAISNLINSIVSELDIFLNSDDLKYIFNILPTVSTESVQSYIVKVINFFKSYKVDFLGISTVYHFTDKMENTIRILDDMVMLRHFDKKELIRIIDFITGKKITLTKEERINLYDTMYMIIDRLNLLDFKSDLGKNMIDKLVSVIRDYIRDDRITITEEISKFLIIAKNDFIFIDDERTIDKLYTFYKDTKFTITEDIKFGRYNGFRDYFKIIEEMFMMNVNWHISQKIRILDDKYIIGDKSIEDMIDLYDTIYIERLNS